MTLLTRFSDRLVELVAPRTTAAATVVQYCGCWRDNIFTDKYHNYKNCEWVGQPGGPLKCGECYTSDVVCG